MFLLGKSYQLKFLDFDMHFLCSDQKENWNTTFILSYDQNKRKNAKFSYCNKVCTQYLIISMLSFL